MESSSVYRFWKSIQEVLVLVFVNTVTYSEWTILLRLATLGSDRSPTMPRTSPFNIELSEEELRELEQRARKYTSPYRDVIRAKIILLAAGGLRNDLIALRLDIPRQIVCKWRKRFCLERLLGLDEQPRGGRLARFSPQRRSPGKGSSM
jgi:Winged helix-turn helix